MNNFFWCILILQVTQARDPTMSRFYNITFPIGSNLNRKYGYVEMEDLLQVRRTLEDVLDDIPGVTVDGSGTLLGDEGLTDGMFDIDISTTRMVDMDRLKERLAQFAKRYHLKHLRI